MDLIDIFTDNYGQLVAHASAISAADADEVMSRVAEKLLNGRFDRVFENGNIIGYLYRTVRNEAISVQRATKRRRGRELTYMTTEPSEPPGPANLTLEHLDHERAGQMVRTAMESSNDRLRTALQMMLHADGDRHGCNSQAEIARLAGYANRTELFKDLRRLAGRLRAEFGVAA